MLASFAAAIALAAAQVPTLPAVDAPDIEPPPQTVAPASLLPELWRGTRVGMTAAQVHALFPDGRAPAPTLVSRPPVANAVVGGAAGWAVEEQVFGYPALATYYFGPNGLLEVVVNVKGLRLRHTRDNVETTRAIRAGLLRYYGRPKICEDTNRRGLVRVDCRWQARGVQIGLSYVDYGGLGPNLDVAVRAPAPTIHEGGAVFARHGVAY